MLIDYLRFLYLQRGCGLVSERAVPDGVWRSGGDEVEDAGHGLPADGVARPAQQRAVVELCARHVLDDGRCGGGAEAIVRHVDHLAAGVEAPLEGDGALRVSHHLARDAHRLLAGHAEHLRLVRLAVRRV